MRVAPAPWLALLGEAAAGDAACGGSHATHPRLLQLRRRRRERERDGGRRRLYYYTSSTPSVVASWVDGEWNSRPVTSGRGSV
jgi:hypothetical protein